MQSKRIITLICVSIIAGVILGLIGGPVLILIPWGMVGLAIGIFSNSKNQAVVCGSLYGFVVAFTFMLSGYRGEASIVMRLVPFAILGVIGAIFGLVLALIGYLVRCGYRSKKTTE